MTMIATATNDTRRKIIGILGMNNPAVAAESPDRPNLCYWVRCIWPFSKKTSSAKKEDIHGDNILQML